MRYYNAQRPITPGSFPEPKDNRVLAIVNFDKKTYCKEPERDCWGYIEYEKPLSEKEASAYELVRERRLNFSQRDVHSENIFHRCGAQRAVGSAGHRGPLLLPAV